MGSRLGRSGASRYSFRGRARAWITDGSDRFAILDGAEIAGMVSLTGIMRGPMQTAWSATSSTSEGGPWACDACGP